MAVFGHSVLLVFELSGRKGAAVFEFIQTDCGKYL